MNSISGNKALNTSTELRWLYIDFNSYFASVEQQLQPRLRGKPVAVMPVATESTCAIAASYEAKAYGVKTGTPIWEAKKLCPGIICVLAQHERYVEYHHRILKEVDNHIPVTMICSIDEVTCQLMKNEMSIIRITEIADSIKRGLAKNVGDYIRCSIGVASNRYLAKVATDLKKPDGFTILGPQDLPQRLFELKLRDLPGIGHNIERRLIAKGITDMQMLLALDAKQMRIIWGSVWGEKMWYLLRGVEFPEEESTRRTIGHSHVLAPELRVPEKAQYVARRLTLKATSRMRRMGYYASALSLSIRIEHGPRLSAEMRCYRAQDSISFINLLNILWAGFMREARGAAIKKISVTLHHLIPVSDLQPELFEALPDIDLHKRQKAEKISQALDKINHRFGRDSVLLGMLPSQGKSFSGTKIAFTRIPDIEEFLE